MSVTAKMKYFAAKIDERNGEYQYTHTRFITAKTLAAAMRQNKADAKAWYGSGAGERNPDGNGWYFNGWCVLVTEGSVREISEHTYREMTLAH